MMWLADPVFLRHEPPRTVQLCLLLTLLWTALPLLPALPLGVSAVFAALWLVRLVLWALNIKPLSWLWLLLLLGLSLAAVFTQLGTIIGQEGGVAFLLLLTILKAYEGRGRRDWQILLLAMLVLMGGAVLFRQDVWMAPWLLTGLVSMGLCMALLGGLNLRQAVRQSMVALLLSLPLTLVLFVAVPRMAEPLWRIPQPNQQQGKTGLSDTMQPGSISDLVQSDEPAFNATFPSGYTPQRAQLYWRVMIMADYNGIQWQAMDERYIDNARARRSTQNVAYQMILRDEQGRIPALDYPLPAASSDVEMRLGAVMRVARSRDGYRRIQLNASTTPYLQQVLSDGERRYYTRLPQANLQTRDLGRRLRTAHPKDTDFINAALSYFRDHGFVYTLQPMRSSGSDRTDYFLFQGREGFCEDYADAFVQLMRAGGLPARVVTGYQGGEYHPQGGFWQIRSKDAHAWAEVWLAEQQAWLRVDPTTAVAEVRARDGIQAALGNEGNHFANSNSWWFRLSQSGQFYWQQWVVNFDADRQNNLFQRLGLSQVGWHSVLLMLLAGGGLALIPALLWWHYQQWRRRQPLAEGLLLLQTRLLGLTTDEAATQGPLELQQALAARQLLDPALQELIDDYIAAVYAHPEAPTAAAQRRWYRRAKRLARRHRRSEHATPAA